MTIYAPTWIPLAGIGRPRPCPAIAKAAPARNKGLRYPADPPTVEEIIAVMRAAGGDADAVRLSGLIVVPWRAGLRISEALALADSDLDSGRGSILVRCGKGSKRREVGMARWAWEQLGPWLGLRATHPGSDFAGCRIPLIPYVGSSQPCGTVVSTSRRQLWVAQGDALPLITSVAGRLADDRGWSKPGAA